MHAIPYSIMEIPSSFMKISSPLIENLHIGGFFSLCSIKAKWAIQGCQGGGCMGENWGQISQG
jgi:hypothetical protein